MTASDRVRRFYRRLDADRAAGRDGVNAVTYALLADEALRLAAESDERTASGRARSPLEGFVVTVKDTATLPVRGWRTTAGSHLSPDVADEADAPAVARVRAAGGLVVARTAAPEFGWKAATSSPRWGVTRSAIDLSRTSGGSSGGAASSVASGMADVALGTDAAGSVRIPAAVQALVGFKPTRGLIPCSSAQELSHVGVIARSTLVVGWAMDGLADRASGRADGGFASSLAAAAMSMPGRHIAFSATLGGVVEADAAVLDVVRGAVDDVFVRALRCVVEEADPPWNGEDPWRAALVFHFAAVARRARDLAATPQDRDRLDPGLRAALADPRLRFGEADVASARAHGRRLVAALMSLHGEGRFDLLMTPTLAREPAFAAECGEDHLVNGRAFWEDGADTARLTFPFNVSGQPAVTVPCGFTDAGQPVGLQIVGPVGADLAVLQAARAFEEVVAMRWGAPRVLVLNGPSSAGKSTVARNIVAAARARPAETQTSRCMRMVSFDDFGLGGLAVAHWSRQFVEAMADVKLLRRCTGPEAWHYSDMRSRSLSPAGGAQPPETSLVLTPLGLAYLHGTYGKWAAMLRCGESLVIDHFVLEAEWYTAMVDRFDGIDCDLACAALECDRNVLEVREALRSRLETRILGTARYSAKRVHDAFRRAAERDYDFVARSYGPEEAAWAAAEYKRVVVRGQTPRQPAPRGDRDGLAAELLAKWER